MTLIAYKNGVLCADTLALSGGKRFGYATLKIARRADGALFAGSGAAAVVQHWMRWFLSSEEGSPPWRETGDDCDCILIARSLGSFEYFATYPIAEKFQESCFALGDQNYLRGLMDGGLGAVDAIKRALENHYYGDYPIIEVGYSGPPIIWESPDRVVPSHIFFERLNIRQEEFFAG